MANSILSISGTRLMLDGRPFLLQGLSFFNAIHNPALHRSGEERRRRLETFLNSGVNCLRVWCQWDFEPPRDFIDVSADTTLYTAQGDVRVEKFRRLADLLDDAAGLGMVIEVTLFSHEKENQLPSAALARGARQMAALLKPYRSPIVQVWNEDSTEIERLYEVIKSEDPERLVTNSPGFGGDLGDDAQNRMLDLLTPHTSRGGVEPFWEKAPKEIAWLLETYQKPVIDDEPARDGTIEFGGIPGGTRPEQHIEQIRRVRALGAYHIYHHDMFQLKYGHPRIPPDGIPAPDFSPSHKVVFDFLKENPAW